MFGMTAFGDFMSPAFDGTPAWSQAPGNYVAGVSFNLSLTDVTPARPRIAVEWRVRTVISGVPGAWSAFASGAFPYSIVSGATPGIGYTYEVELRFFHVVTGVRSTSQSFSWNFS